MDDLRAQLRTKAGFVRSMARWQTLRFSCRALWGLALIAYAFVLLGLWRDNHDAWPLWWPIQILLDRLGGTDWGVVAPIAAGVLLAGAGGVLLAAIGHIADQRRAARLFEQYRARGSIALLCFPGDDVWIGEKTTRWDALRQNLFAVVDQAGEPGQVSERMRQAQRMLDIRPGWLPEDELTPSSRYDELMRICEDATGFDGMRLYPARLFADGAPASVWIAPNPEPGPGSVDCPMVLIFGEEGEPRLYRMTPWANRRWYGNLPEIRDARAASRRGKNP